MYAESAYGVLYEYTENYNDKLNEKWMKIYPITNEIIVKAEPNGWSSRFPSDTTIA